MVFRLLNYFRYLFASIPHKIYRTDTLVCYHPERLWGSAKWQNITRGTEKNFLESYLT